MEARAIPPLLILLVTHVSGLPPCPYSDAAGDHHFVPPGVSKTIHIHQPSWQTGPAYSWNEAQDFCEQTYNNGTYSGGRLWEPQTLAEYNAVRTELGAVFPLTGQACMWWIGMKSPGDVVPKDALKASNNALISWHTVDFNHGWGSSDCVSMDVGWPFMTGNRWTSYDCDSQKAQWICESVHRQEEIKDKKSKIKYQRCETTRKCQNAFTWLRGFCSDVSWLGGGCKHKDGEGNILCEEKFGVRCNCCKECLNIKCSQRGEGWECVHATVASEYPVGSCFYDMSCQTPYPPAFNDSTCACCLTQDQTSTSTSTATTKEPSEYCDDAGCEKELNGLGSCVNVTNADWKNLSSIYQLSTPSRPGLCKHPHNRHCCTCLKKRECIDLGCMKHWNGTGMCLNVTSKEFAETSHLINFTAGGRDDLCKSGIKGEDCCTCFQVKAKKNAAADCCAKKTVGGVEYVLAEVYEDAEDVAGLGCKDGCVYVARNGIKVCFKSGKFPASCQ